MLDTLEDDTQHEFKGGTLSISSETKLTTDKLIKTDSSDKNDNESTKANNNNWTANFISPLTSIPNKISATLWTRKPKTPTPTKDNVIQPSICLNENPDNFFTFRESVLARALNECKEQFLDEESDGPLLDAFLLTQISHWNTDKERLLLLTPQTLVIAKYDFIALKRLGYKKLPLELIDEIIFGDLIYPNGSLIPQVNGIVDGLSNVLETCLLSKWSRGDKQISNFFEARNRNRKGVRLIWNKTEPVSASSYWNPFNENVPFCTFTYHPLFYHKDCVDEKLKKLYCLETFVEKLTKLLIELPRNNELNKDRCVMEEKDIILQTYIGIGSIIHNRNDLGFFKVRGKFSF